MQADFNAAKFGYFVSIITAILTVITFGIAISTPPLSGPFCTGSCFEYPYTDIANRFPRDYYWMYPAILLSFTYLMMIVSIHHITTNGRKKLYGMIGVSFAAMSALVLSADYFIQVSVIQPSLLSGETEGIALLTQFNPHGIFIVLEEMGFLLMSISFVALIPVFSGTAVLEKAIKLTSIISFALVIVSFALIAFIYGVHREYRFEVAVITITWIELILISIFLSRYFKRIKIGSVY